MSQANDNRVMYRPFKPVIGPGFWKTLMDLKLDELRLSQDPLDIHGSYWCGQAKDLPCMASLDESSFSEVRSSPNYKTCQLYGKLICFNTKKDFFDSPSTDFIKNIGEDIWKSICSGEALSDPEGCLSRFGMLVHADLKKYKFTFMFAFPALLYPKCSFLVNPHQNILDVMVEKSIGRLQMELQKQDEHRSFQRGYFIVLYSKELSNSDNCGLLVYPLTEYDKAQQECSSRGFQLYFAFNDPSSFAQDPGWTMRNYLALISMQFKLQQINLIRLRVGSPMEKSQISLHHSLIMNIKIEQDLINIGADDLKCPKVSGWDMEDFNEAKKSKICVRKVDLSNLMDPKVLASNAVDLNLRLMKWRLKPSLDLDKIANTKCLLLGCGTLGCHVARGLLAWGVKNLTLVDNSRISYSNPVRQSLYFFDDCSAGKEGAFKAEVAASRLLKIHPTLNVGFNILSIPMPGHSVGPNEFEQTKRDVEKLDQLIEEHETIFLMTDTRESRWLPTVISIAKGKLLINSAIGFDTFLIQRHPIRQTQPNPIPFSATSDSSKISSDQLGCYFCSDVVAPGNSTLDRTLDQQCTVSRPGVSMLVSALVVELFASIMSSPMGPNTPAHTQIPSDTSQVTEDHCDSDLGMVPHSIRGDIHRYHLYMPTSPCFNKCSACSEPVVKAYREDGFDFLCRVFNDSNYLEEIAGLKELHDFDIGSAIALDSDEDFDLDA